MTQDSARSNRQIIDRMVETMRCPRCAVEIVEEALFCHQCGHRLKEVGGEDPRSRFTSAVGTGDGEDEPEQELWQGQFSKLAMIGAWIGAALFSLALVILAVVGGYSGTAWAICLLVIVLVWVGLLVRLLYRQLSQHYYLTNRRFVHEKGLLWRSIDRIEAIDIDDVSYQQGPVERALGVGTIRISSSDTSDPLMEMPGIENVKDVAEMIDEVRRQERRKRGLHIEAV